jgi:hypothetical protein
LCNYIVNNSRQYLGEKALFENDSSLALTLYSKKIRNKKGAGRENPAPFLFGKCQGDTLQTKMIFRNLRTALF